MTKVNVPGVSGHPEIRTLIKEFNTIGYATDLTFDNTAVMKYLIKMTAPYQASLAISYISPVGFPITPSETEHSFTAKFNPGKNHPTITYQNIKETISNRI
ncbi:hypothetical protein [Mucilaginibacter sp.]|uniref:hypothetical protein n=1 Tax=Mucilaginibacter sp. TaxID=1882438 RepID=UPI003266C2E1